MPPKTAPRKTSKDDNELFQKLVSYFKGKYSAIHRNFYIETIIIIPPSNAGNIVRVVSLSASINKTEVLILWYERLYYLRI